MIVTDHQPLMYLQTSRTSTKKQLSWRGYKGQDRTRIIYRLGHWQYNYLANALSRLYTEDKCYPHIVEDPTKPDSENDTWRVIPFTASDPEEMSQFVTNGDKARQTLTWLMLISHWFIIFDSMRAVD